MGSFLQDLRFGFRQLVRNPGFAITIVAVLALCIAANTVLLGVINAKLLRPLPYSDPERLVQIWEVNRAEGERPGTISPFNFLDWQDESYSFDSMAVFAFANWTLTEPDSVQRIFGARVSGDFFSVLGVPPLLGRTLSSEDDQPDTDRVVLSHRAWQRRFAGDPDIVDETLTLDGRPHTVVGVMPPEVHLPTAFIELWTTPAFDLEGLNRGDHFLFGIGRLSSELSLLKAQVEMNTIADRLARIYKSSNQDFGVLLVPLREAIFGNLRDDLLLLWGGVALVLAIACVNVANLLLARAVSRRTEVAVRVSMGCSRGRIIRQFLTESLLLATLGGGAGLVLAAWGTRYLASGHGPRILQSEHLHLGGWMVVVNVVVTLVTAVLFGIAPALHVGRRQVRSQMNPLHQGGLQIEKHGWKLPVPKLLVALQVSLAVVLLTSAGLLVKSLYLLHQVDVGFDPKGLLTLQLSVPTSKAPTPTHRAGLFQQVVDRIEAVPGVEGAAAVNDLPFSGSRTRVDFDIVGFPPEAEGSSRKADYRIATGDYFEVLGLALLHGRSFEVRDGPDASRVAVINQALARRYFQGVESPVGMSLVLRGEEARIIGVVENLKHESLAADDAPEVYVPVQQAQLPERLFLAVRSNLDGQSLLPALRSAIWEVVPDHPVYDVRSLEARLLRSISQQRLSSLLFSVFAGVALILVPLGIYGLVSYAARQRTREIAIRMALGGRRSDVIRIVVKSGMVPVALGLVVGLPLAYAAAQTLRAKLFGIQPTDPAILLAVPLLLTAAAALASYLPARRATTTNPAIALRDG